MSNDKHTPTPTETFKSFFGNFAPTQTRTQPCRNGFILKASEKFGALFND